MSAPLPFRWSGEAMEILPRFAKNADAAFVIGRVYRMETIEDRSIASHRQYFASLHEAWLNLRDDAAERFTSEEALRKYALIRTGYADSTSIVASSRTEALRLAAFIRPMDEFSVVTVEGCTVTRWTAKSQSMRAMGKKDFEASKKAVLEYVASLIGVRPEQIEKERAA